MKYATYRSMSLGHIYLLINKVNGHKYVGQTKRTVNDCWKQHLEQARRMSPKPIHRAIRKHGAHQFMIRDLCECSIEELDEREQEFIDKYKTEESIHYNSPVKEQEQENNPPVEEKQENLWGFQKPENRGDGKHNRMRILAINVDTLEEKEYESLVSASIAISGDNKSVASISRACKNNWIYLGHRYKKLDDKERSIKVYGVHYKTWEETNTFSSIREASRIMGINDNGIRRSIAHPYKKRSGQYFWFKA